MTKLRPNAERARIAIVLLWIAFVISIVQLITEILQWTYLSDIQAGMPISYEDADRIDMMAAIVAIVYAIVYIISAVTFIQWFRRAYFNMHQLTSGLAYTEGWAAGAWFIPIFSWFAPYKIASDLYDNASSLLHKQSIMEPQPSYTTIRGAWWAAWILSGIVGTISTQIERNAESVSGMIAALDVGIVSSIFAIVAAPLAIMVVKNYAKMEALLPKLAEVDAMPRDDNPELLDADL